MIANETTPLMTNRAFVWAGLLLAGLCALAPSAQAVVLATGNVITGGTPWDRPDVINSFPPEVPAGTTGFANGFKYVATTFHVDVTGTYALKATTTGPSWDNFSVLYHDSFSGAAPLTNVILADDDYTAAIYTNTLPGESGFNGINPALTLTAGINYIFVETSFQLSGNFTGGAYSLDVTGPGNAIPGAVVVVAAPEPLSLGLFLTGLAGLAAARRRRRTS